jgi:PAP2 superfamily
MFSKHEQVPSFSISLEEVSHWLTGVLNGLAGKSWLLDSLISLPMENDFVKAVPLGGCVLATWLTTESPATAAAARRTLIAALVAAVFVLASTKLLAHAFCVPRPFVSSQKTFYLENGALTEGRRLNFRPGLDAASQQNYRKLVAGEISAGDLRAYPSDHAGFFVTLALGVWFASRSIGLLAVAWTFGVILSPRVITATHSVIDVLAGAAIALASLLFCLAIASRWLRPAFDRIVEWTVKYNALSTALLFAVLFEAASTLRHVWPLLHFGTELARRFKHAFT